MTQPCATCNLPTLVYPDDVGDVICPVCYDRKHDVQTTEYIGTPEERERKIENTRIETLTERKP